MNKPVPKNESIKFSVNIKTECVVLVERGCQHPILIDAKNFLIDKNIMVTIEGIANGKQGEVYATTKRELITSLSSKPVLINPMLAAFEDVKAETPNFSEFKQSLETYYQTIDKAGLTPQIYNYNETKNAYEFLTDIESRLPNEARFLMDCYPLIFNTVPNEKLLEIEEQIFTISKKHKTDLMSLTLIAVLSCLYKWNTSRKLLKLKQNYSKQYVYNSLQDLFALRVNIGLIAYSNSTGAEPLYYCTRDRDLQSFWTAFQFKNIRAEVPKVMADFEINEIAFPNLAEHKRLGDKLLAHY